MKPGFFIDRPVFSTVLSILIVIVGIIGLALLPVDQYPQITPPVVKISATYPGASALTVSQAVATPIEQELNGVEGFLYMASTSERSKVAWQQSLQPGLQVTQSGCSSLTRENTASASATSASYAVNTGISSGMMLVMGL